MTQFRTTVIALWAILALSGCAALSLRSLQSADTAGGSQVHDAGTAVSAGPANPAGTGGRVFEPHRKNGVKIQPISGFEEAERMWVGYDNIERIVLEPGEPGPEGYFNLGSVHAPYDGHWYQFADGHEFSSQHVKAGSHSFRWFYTPRTSRIVSNRMPRDWSEYGFVSFWAYSEAANFAAIEFVCYSEDLDSPMDDYYKKEIVVDWEGWKFIEIPFDVFTPTRKPIGWHHIDYIKIASTGWGHTALDDTVLHLDDLNLTSESIAPDPLATMVVELPELTHPFLFGDAEFYRAAMEKAEKTGWADSAFVALEQRAVDIRNESPSVPKTGGGFYHDEEDASAYMITEEHYRLSRGADACGIVYQMTGDESYGLAAKGILLQYAESYLTYERHDKYGNTGEKAKTGGRATAQAINEAKWIIPLARAYDTTFDLFGPNERERVEARLFRPAAELIGANNEGKHNHQAWYNAGVGVIGFLLRDPDMVKYAVYGPDNGFLFQMRASIGNDGMWYEGSGHYHFYTMDPLVSLAEAAAFSGIDLYENDALRSFFRFPGLYAGTSGLIPVINDGRRVDITLDERARFLEVAYYRLRDPGLVPALRAGNRATWQALLYGVEDLPEPAETGAGSALLGEALAVLRAGDLFATLNGRPYSGGHSHYDKLSITIQAEGRVIAPDSGSIKYRNPAQDAYFKSTSAHNTVVKDYEFQRYVGASKTEIFSPGPRYQVVRMSESEAYADTEMTRTLVMSDWYLFDVYTVRPSAESATPEADYLWVYRNYGSLEPGLHMRPIELPQSGGFEYWTDPVAAELTGDHTVSYNMYGGERCALHFPSDGLPAELIAAEVPIAAEKGDVIAPRPYDALALRKRADACAFPVVIVPGAGNVDYEVTPLRVGAGNVAGAGADSAADDDDGDPGAHTARGAARSAAGADSAAAAADSGAVAAGAAVAIARGDAREILASFSGMPKDRTIGDWQTDAAVLAVRATPTEVTDILVVGASYLKGREFDFTFGPGFPGLRRPRSVFHFVLTPESIEVVNGGPARIQVSLAGLEGRAVLVGGEELQLRHNPRTGRGDLIVNPR